MASTSVTFMLEGFAFALTLRANLLRLHSHYSHIDLLHVLSSALAFGTGLEFTIVGTWTFAFWTIDIPFDSRSGVSSNVQFFQRSFYGYLMIGTLLSVISSILDALKLFLSHLVIDLTFFRVIKDLVCPCDVWKFGCCFLVTRILIRMIFACLRFVSLFYFSLLSILLNI